MGGGQRRERVKCVCGNISVILLLCLLRRERERELFAEVFIVEKCSAAASCITAVAASASRQRFGLSELSPLITFKLTYHNYTTPNILLDCR